MRNGNGAGKADHAQPEGGAGERENQPALGHVLHPGADVGEKVAAPEEAEVGVAQGADDFGELVVLLVGKGGSGCGGFFDGQAAGLLIQLAVGGQKKSPLGSSVSFEIISASLLALAGISRIWGSSTHSAQRKNR